MWVLSLCAYGGSLHHGSVTAWIGWGGAHRADAVGGQGLFHGLRKRKEMVHESESTSPHSRYWL